MAKSTTLYKVREVADHYGVTNATVLTWARKGKVMAVRLADGHYRITGESFQKLLQTVPRKKAR